MKNLFNRKRAIIATAIFALIIIVLGVILHKSQNKSVDLSRNTPIDKISLVAEELSPRNIRIEDSSKTILGSIPQLKINAEVIDEEDSITSGLPVSNSDWGYQNNSGKEFIAFEYQDKDVTSLITMTPQRGGAWFAKGGTKVEGGHYDDLSVQKYVLDNCGLKIHACYLMHLNSDYVKTTEEINIKELFVLEDLTHELKPYSEIEENLKTHQKWWVLNLGAVIFDGVQGLRRFLFAGGDFPI